MFLEQDRCKDNSSRIKFEGVCSFSFSFFVMLILSHRKCIKIPCPLSQHFFSPEINTFNSFLFLPPYSKQYSLLTAPPLLISIFHTPPWKREFSSLSRIPILTTAGSLSVSLPSRGSDDVLLYFIFCQHVVIILF